jgi:hypothetical protein
VEWETVVARDVTVGDVIRIDAQDGWWKIVAVFHETGHVLDIDVRRTDGRASHEWFAGLDRQVQRAL